MACENLSHLKKYAERGSPPFPANQCRGATKRGNDGHYYVSVGASNGVYRWQKKVKAGAKRSPKKTAKKTAKKSVKRSPKKTAKKFVKRSPKKSTKRSPKKTAKKSVKRSPKKSVKKTAKKSVKRSPKKSVKKTAKKSVKRSPKKSTKKTAKKSVKRSPKKSKRTTKPPIVSVVGASTADVQKEYKRLCRWIERSIGRSYGDCNGIKDSKHPKADYRTLAVEARMFV